MVDRFMPFLLVILIFATSAVYAEPSSNDQSKGIITFPLNKAPLDILLRKKPDTESDGIALLLIKPATESAHSYLYKEWQEENPDAGWFDEKTILKKSETPIDEYKSGDRVGPYVFEETPNWVRLKEGWLKKSDLSPFDGVYATWNEVMHHDKFPEFHLPNKDKFTTLGKIDDMRKSARYSANGPVEIYKSKGGSQRLMAADDSLRFAIMGHEDGWINVFVVLNVCDARSGKRDYREGTNGWIPIRQPSGQPSLITREEKC